MSALVFVFACAFVLVAYVYFGYPLLLWVLARVRRRSPQSAAGTPFVSVIVTVHNGAGVIAAKLADTLAVSYPEDRIEILVASDGSTDETNSTVGAVRDSRVRLVEVPTRRGKEAAQREAIAVARGDVLVFTDAGVSMERDAIRAIVAAFGDPGVGCVSGVDRVTNREGEAEGESAFVRYETRLKRLESDTGSTVGNSGWLFGVRRELCDEWPADMASDFTMVLRTVRRGLRGIVEPRAVARATATRSGGREFDRKVRTIVRGMVVLNAHRDLLNPLRYGLFSLQLVSHKVLRWCLPFLLAVMLISSAVLSVGSITFRVLLAGQTLFYALGILWPGARIPRFFVISSAATLVAWWKFLAGERFVVWDPTPRTLEMKR